MFATLTFSHSGIIITPDSLFSSASASRIVVSISSPIRWTLSGRTIGNISPLSLVENLPAERLIIVVLASLDLIIVRAWRMVLNGSSSVPPFSSSPLIGFTKNTS